MAESYQATREATVGRLTDSMERQFGVSRDVARAAAEKRTDAAMRGVLREHEKTGRTGPIEINSK